MSHDSSHSVEVTEDYSVILFMCGLFVLGVLIGYVRSTAEQHVHALIALMICSSLLIIHAWKSNRQNRVRGVQ